MKTRYLRKEYIWILYKLHGENLTLEQRENVEDFLRLGLWGKNDYLRAKSKYGKTHDRKYLTNTIQRLKKMEEGISRRVTYGRL